MFFNNDNCEELHNKLFTVSEFQILSEVLRFKSQSSFERQASDDGAAKVYHEKPFRSATLSDCRSSISWELIFMIKWKESVDLETQWKLLFGNKFIKNSRHCNITLHTTLTTELLPRLIQVWIETKLTCFSGNFSRSHKVSAWDRKSVV